MSRKGGRAKSNTARAKRQYTTGSLDSDQILGLVGTTIVGVLAGRISPGVANAVASLARTSIAIGEAIETEARLAELERRAGIDKRDRIA